MARYESKSSAQGLFLAIQLEDQYDKMSRERLIKQYIQEHVKLSDFDEYYDNDEKGRKVKNPKDVIAAIVYGYMTGNRSSRKIEKLLDQHIGFMFISNMLKIDHSVICEFKIKFKAQLENILADLLHVLNEMGAIDWSIVTGDGTKIKAYANKGKNIGKERTEKLLKTYQKLAENIVKRDLELEKAGSEGSVSKKEYQQEKKRVKRQKKIYDNVLQKISEFRNNDEINKTLDTEYCNLTDPDSKLMPGSDHKSYIQGYNTILMTSNNDIILDRKTVTTPEKQHTTDLVMGIEELKDNLTDGQAEPSKYLFDSGFQKLENTLSLCDDGIDMYVDSREKDFSDKASKRKDFRMEEDETGLSMVCRGNRRVKGSYSEKADQYTFWFHRSGCKECQFYPECYQKIKETTTAKTVAFSGFEIRNREKINNYLAKMNSEEGKRTYNKRLGKEHVNANLKTQRNYEQTYYRGTDNVHMDSGWAVLAHNLSKYCLHMVM